MKYSLLVGVQIIALSIVEEIINVNCRTLYINDSSYNFVYRRNLILM